MKRIILEIVLLTAFIVLMDIRYIGKSVHECLALAIFAVVGVHVFWNIGFIKGLFKGTYTRYRAVLTALNVLLIAGMLALLGSGVIISDYLFADFIPEELSDNKIFKTIHKSSGYYLIALLGLHLGMHWRMFLPKIQDFLGLAKSKLRRYAFRAVHLLFLGFGLYAIPFYNYHLWWALTRPPKVKVEPTLFTFFYLVLGIIVIFATIGHYLQVYLNRKRVS